MRPVSSAISNFGVLGRRDTVTSRSGGNRRSHIARGRDWSQLRLEVGCRYETERVLGVFSIDGEWLSSLRNREEGQPVNSEGASIDKVISGGGETEVSSMSRGSV